MQLIDTTYLSTYTSVSSQEDAKKLNAAILQAGQFHVEPLIGVDHKATLEGQLEPNQAGSAPWQKLLALVRPFYALATQYDLLLDRLVEVAAKGNMQPEGTAPLEIIKLRREDIQAKMAMLRDQIVAHLAAHPEEFGQPERPAAPTQHSLLILVHTPPVYFGG